MVDHHRKVRNCHLRPCGDAATVRRPMQQSADNPNTSEAPVAKPPRSWLAVAALLEQHGFGEVADDPFAATDGGGAVESAPNRRR
jgi:hypothetical protein